MVREMFLYPWDLMDEGVQRVSDKLCAYGVEHVSLAALYHQARLLLPHNPRRKLLMHSGGSCYFPFNAGAYGVLGPKASPLLADGAFWGGMLEAFAKQGVSVSAWMVLMHNSTLASAYPEHALMNVYGDRSPSNLCPSSPEAQRYVCRLAKDLYCCGVEQMDAESLDFAGFLHGDHHEMQAYQDTATLNRLLGLCFCPHCMAQAHGLGIDAEALRSQLRKAADAFLAFEKPCPVDQVLLSAYDDMRALVIAGLYKRIRDESGLRVRPILWLAGGANPLDSGVDVRKMDVPEAIVCYPDAPEKTEACMSRAHSFVPEGVCLTGGVRLMAPQTIEPGQGPAFERAYAKQGVNRIVFYNYGMAPQAMLNALLQSGTV